MTRRSGRRSEGGAAAGEFVLPENQARPLVLLSGGVGLTPMVCMFETLAEAGANVPVHFVHGTLSGAAHAMSERLRQSADDKGFRVTTFYQQSRTEDSAHDHAGLITMEWLAQNTPLHEADFFICGPKPFLKAFVNGLSLAGVAQDRIHYEFFGPADELLAA